MTRKLMFLMIAMPTLATADMIDGSKPLLCAPEEAQECDEVEDCMSVDDESLGLAEFLEVDFKNKRIRAAGAEKRDYQESPIHRVEKLDVGVLIQGSENELAWSMSISGDSGDMVLAVAGLDHGFVVFGSCTNK